MKKLQKLACAFLAMAVVFTSAAVLPMQASAAAKPCLNKTSLSLAAGKTAQLKVKAAGTAKITWKTSDKAVVTVTSKGKVKAVAAGTATVTAKVAKTTLKCKVTVTAAATDVTAALSGKSFTGTTTTAVGDITVLKLAFAENGAVSGSKMNTDTLTMEDFSGTYTASLAGSTLTITVTGSTGTSETYALTVTSADMSTATATVSGFDVTVKLDK